MFLLRNLAVHHSPQQGDELFSSARSLGLDLKLLKPLEKSSPGNRREESRS